MTNAFGRLQAGRWERSPDGTVAAVFPDPPARRIPWRIVDRPLAAATDSGTPATVRFGFPEQLAPADDEEQVIEASLRGLGKVVAKLQLAAPASLSMYVHPDRRSKLSLTGDQGDGHAVVAAGVLHFHADPSRTTLCPSPPAGNPRPRFAAWVPRAIRSSAKAWPSGSAAVRRNRAGRMESPTADPRAWPSCSNRLPPGARTDHLPPRRTAGRRRRRIDRPRCRP